MNEILDVLIAIAQLLMLLIIYSEERVNELTTSRKFSVFVTLPMIAIPSLVVLWGFFHEGKKPKHNQKKVHVDLGSLLVIAGFILYQFYQGPQ